jgi:hypothetical protein
MTIDLFDIATGIAIVGIVLIPALLLFKGEP